MATDDDMVLSLFPDSTEGCTNVGPTSGRQYRRWVNRWANLHCCLHVLHACKDATNDYDIDGLVQGRRGSSALAMELRLSCISPTLDILNISNNVLHKVNILTMSTAWISPRMVLDLDSANFSTSVLKKINIKSPIIHDYATHKVQ